MKSNRTRDRKVTLTIAVPLSVLAAIDEESERTEESISAIISRRLAQSLSARQ